MVNVAFFVVFAMALFSIVGVQSFKGSFERNCVWIDPAGQSNNTLNQMCGGHVDPVNGDLAPFFRSDGSQSTVMGPKGFICPLGQLCIVSVYILRACQDEQARSFASHGPFASLGRGQSLQRYRELRQRCSFTSAGCCDHQR